MARLGNKDFLQSLSNSPYGGLYHSYGYFPSSTEQTQQQLLSQAQPQPLYDLRLAEALIGMPQRPQSTPQVTAGFPPPKTLSSFVSGESPSNGGGYGSKQDNTSGHNQGTLSTKCSTCSNVFKNRNRLLKHVQSTGHIAVDSETPEGQEDLNPFGMRFGLAAEKRPQSTPQKTSGFPPPRTVPSFIPSESPSSGDSYGSRQDNTSGHNQGTLSTQCSTCFNVFRNRNRLLKHVQNTGHIAVDSETPEGQEDLNPSRARFDPTALLEMASISQTDLPKSKFTPTIPRARPETFSARTITSAPLDPPVGAQTWHQPSKTVKIDSSNWEAYVAHCKLTTLFDGDLIRHVYPEGTDTWIDIDQLGEGGQGTVMKQENQKTKEMRAVKTMLKSRNPQFYQREIGALAMFKDDEHFVKFLGWYDDRNTICIALEFMEHGDLKKHISSGFAKTHAVEITRQILEGLAILHENNVCHRDIKPQNVLVASLNPVRVKITDFGGSKNEDGTQLRTKILSHGYAPPEMHYSINRGKTLVYTNKIDIWSLGCMVHEMLTQEVPFSRGRPLTMTSGIETTQSSIPDDTIVGEFYKGSIPLPMDHLLKCRVDKTAKDFLKYLLVVDATNRPSAGEALNHTWLTKGRYPWT